MGLDYGSDIFCDRSKLWDFIDAVVELDQPGVGYSTTLTFGEQQKVVPLYLSAKTTLSLDDPENDDGICLSLPFVVDDEIRNYLKEQQEYWRKHYPQYEPWEPQIDSQGRVYIGCVYFYIVTDLDAIGRTGYDENLVGFEFRAATNRMSRLFQKSKSVHQTFVELAKKHEAVYCMFSSNASVEPRVLWLDGKEYSVPISENWLEMSESVFKKSLYCADV